jgi:hypothetical protein
MQHEFQRWVIQRQKMITAALLDPGGPAESAALEDSGYAHSRRSGKFRRVLSGR